MSDVDMTIDVADGLLEPPRPEDASTITTTDDHSTPTDGLALPAALMSLHELSQALESSSSDDAPSLERVVASIQAMSPADALQAGVEALRRVEAFAGAAGRGTGTGIGVGVGSVRELVRAALSRGRGAVESLVPAEDGQEKDAGDEFWEEMRGEDREVLRCFALLNRALERLDDWEAMFPARPQVSLVPGAGAGDLQTQKDTDQVVLGDPWAEAEGQGDEVDLDDPWADNRSEKGSSGGSSSAPAQQSSTADTDTDIASEPPVPLSTFLLAPLADTAFELAATASVRSLGVLRARRGTEIFGRRCEILEAVPPWVLPADLREAGLLPDVQDGMEVAWTSSAEDASDPSGRLGEVCARALRLESAADASNTAPRAAPDVAAWYISQVDALDAYGLVDVQLAWAQLAASQDLGLSELDVLGEDLSLLSRLVYDASLTPDVQAEWTLAQWRAAKPERIVGAYLAHVGREDVVRRVREAVLPYLYVLESRAERAGNEDKGLVERYLTKAVLGLPLRLALPLFEASKATLPKTERVIKDDLVVARLALALLYGTDALPPATSGGTSDPFTTASASADEWATRSAIFECLPVWDVSGRDPADDAELTSTTLDSIAAFVRPTLAQPRPPRPEDLMMFFAPLPFAALSRALDILDVHLESGEILARWGQGVEMRFLLQSARDEGEQAGLCKRLVSRVSAGGAEGVEKRSGGILGGRGLGRREVDREAEKWDRLWGDLLRLNGTGDQLLRGAFGMMDGAEIMRVYLAGILRSGKLDIARKMIARLQRDHGLDGSTLEDVVLSTSRDLYEAAETGNLRVGEMKLAYELLGVAPSSTAMKREKDFIEATSQLSTFSLPSLSEPGSSSAIAASTVTGKRGGTLTPREIRGTSNKLDLIRLVLTHSADAFRHETMMLDLAAKLGLSGEVQRGRVWVALSAAAADAGEWEVAAEYLEKGLGVVKALEKRVGERGRKSNKLGRAAGTTAPGTETDGEAEAGDVDAPRALREGVCAVGVRVGASTPAQWADVERKLAILSGVLEVCEPREMVAVLKRWKEVEVGRVRLDVAAKRRRVEGVRLEDLAGGAKDTGRRAQVGSDAHAHALAHAHGDAAEEERVLGSRTAARAAKLALNFGGRLGSRLPVQLPLPRSASPAGTGVGAGAGAGAGDGASGVGVGGLFGLRRGSGARGSSGSLRSLREGHEAGQGRGRTSGEYARVFDGLGEDRDGGGQGGQGGHARGGGDVDDSALGYVADDVERVRRGARRALVQGVGWLLGADERDADQRG